MVGKWEMLNIWYTRAVYQTLKTLQRSWSKLKLLLIQPMTAVVVGSKWQSYLRNSSVTYGIHSTWGLCMASYCLTYSEETCHTRQFLHSFKKYAVRNWPTAIWPTLSDTANNPFRVLTCTPPDGWWIIMRALGRECLIPGAPAANSRLAMLQAWPTHQVAIGGRIYCMVS